MAATSFLHITFAILVALSLSNAESKMPLPTLRHPTIPLLGQKAAAVDGTLNQLSDFLSSPQATHMSMQVKSDIADSIERMHQELELVPSGNDALRAALISDIKQQEQQVKAEMEEEQAKGNIETDLLNNLPSRPQTPLSYDAPPESEYKQRAGRVSDALSKLRDYADSTTMRPDRRRAVMTQVAAMEADTERVTKVPLEERPRLVAAMRGREAKIKKIFQDQDEEEDAAQGQRLDDKRLQGLREEGVHRMLADLKGVEEEMRAARMSPANQAMVRVNVQAMRTLLQRFTSASDSQRDVILAQLRAKQKVINEAFEAHDRSQEDNEAKKHLLQGKLEMLLRALYSPAISPQQLGDEMQDVGRQLQQIAKQTNKKSSSSVGDSIVVEESITVVGQGAGSHHVFHVPVEADSPDIDSGLGM